MAREDKEEKDFIHICIQLWWITFIYQTSQAVTVSVLMAN